MTNILIADDHALVRDTIAAFLQNIEDFEVTTAGDYDAAISLMNRNTPIDLLILDYNMPGMRGLHGVKLACQKFEKTKVALMSGVASREVATTALANGAVGFFPKSLTPTSLVNAIRFVLSGEKYFPYSFETEVRRDASQDEFLSLSEREKQALEHLCVGLSNKEIARNMGIQEVTVKLHVKNVLAKLAVSNRTQAALLAKERHYF
jgi:DNA-binding NarL/FixJ family response regulator